MSNSFRAVSLSHKNTPVEIRELISLDEELCKALLVELRADGLEDILVLSTCNRTEVYYSHNTDYSEKIINYIGALKNIKSIKKQAKFFDVFNEAQEAIKHLFYVSMGLESQVVGDMQISNQVKNAYQWAADIGTPGPFLHRLMHTIFFTNKRVVQETPFRSGAASTSYAAVELVEELTNEINNPKVLILGVGEIGKDVFLNLQNTNIEDINISNRTRAKAEALASKSEAKVVDFENVWQAIQEADVIVSSIARKEPFINPQVVQKIKNQSFKFFIDLSVPRSIAPEIEQNNGMLVYNIDNIQNKASQALEKRLQSIPDVKAIVHESIAEFQEWAKDMDVSPTIKKFKQALEKIRLEELDRYMKDLNKEESKKLDKITKSMMQKILKVPVLQLKAACRRGDAEELIEGLEDLFNLEKDTSKSRIY